MENEKILIIQFQLTRYKVLALLTAFFICFHPKILGSEQLTLTTYYPSPYGGYAKLLTTDQTILARDGGKVGVGALSPRADTKLDVDGAIGTSRMGVGGTYDSTEVQGIWSIAPNYKISTGPNDFGNQYGMVYAHTNAGTGTNKKPIAGWGHQILFTNNGTRNAAISMSGNGYFGGRVGIGDTSPSYPLDVNGDARITGVLRGMCNSVPYTVGPVKMCGANERVFAYYGNGIPQIVGFLPKSGTMAGAGTYISLGQDWNGTMLCCRIQ